MTQDPIQYRSINTMTKIHLINLAAKQPTAWESTIVGHLGQSQLKVLRMDEGNYPAEVHSCSEALLVLEGVMYLETGGVVHMVNAGEVYLVPAGEVHAVAPGSHGTLVILDAAQ